MIGERIGRYEILSPLAGEAGIRDGEAIPAWEAEDTLLRRRVVLRILPSSLAADERARRCFLQEARKASTLEHPGIATIYDVAEEGGQVYMASQLLEGRTLRDYRDDRSLPLGEASRLGLQVARALEHAHSRGVLHGGVTADSIVITPRGDAVLTGFALWSARARPGDTSRDVQDLGRVLCWMRTGADPEPGSVPDAWTDEGVVPALRRAMLHAIAAGPGARTPTAAELATVLEKAAISHGESGPGRETAARDMLPPPGRRRVLAVLAVMALGPLIWLGVHQFWPGEWPAAGRERAYAGRSGPIRVAILPFENPGDAPRQSEYLASGLTESLIIRLSQIPEIQVTPWMTARRFAGKVEADPVELADELGVDWLVTGSLGLTDNRVRATVSLIEPARGLQTWGDEVETSPADILAVQKHLVAELARRLKGELTGVDEKILDKEPTGSTEAYNAYLRAQSLLVREDEFSGRLAESLFSKAIELDPDFTLAYVGRGSVRSGRYFHGEGGVEDLKLAEADFRQALALDPDLSLAHRGLVHVLWQSARQEECLTEAQEIHRRGLDDVDGLLARATAFLMCGLLDDAMPLFQAVLDLDPANEAALWMSVATHGWAGEYEEAIQAGRRYLERFGQDPEVHLWMGFARHLQGRLEAARPHYEATDRLFSQGTSNMYYLFYLGLFHARLGDHHRARLLWQRGLEETRTKLEAHPDNKISQVYNMVYAGLLGDRDAMTRIYDRMLSQPSSTPWDCYVPHVYVYHDQLDRALDLLRHWSSHTPGFAELLRGQLQLYAGDELIQSPELQAFLKELDLAISGLRRRHGLTESLTR